MDRLLPTVIVVVVLLSVFTLMYRSWRKRSKRDSAIVAGYPFPSAPGKVLAVARGYYVATTPRDTPLERLFIPGLGFRARAEITATDAGVTLDLTGSRSVFVPVGAIDILTPATWAIDRVVEKDGLMLLGWQLPPVSPGLNAPAEAGRSVDSYFRIIDPSERVRLVDAIRSIAAGATGPADRDESEV
ncbi:hypothetical protein GY21_05850 [Cryobacterium roopkundense]|uniref:PH domain-containing protein n=1 Tax=Cryobacterium roopkundense TaxID=1001240 RepID=A0A099JLF5_9MICO|nr:hypothetical protein [Cryobacterium roopkundense]KGJ79174.1 hypothetical protein GY21_05850 [Cryobacterium roopkundense]MBB5641365.1 hypothetical protein [Cryobacterium roopkundense]